MICVTRQNSEGHPAAPQTSPKPEIPINTYGVQWYQCRCTVPTAVKLAAVWLSIYWYRCMYSLIFIVRWFHPKLPQEHGSGVRIPLFSTDLPYWPFFSLFIYWLIWSRAPRFRPKMGPGDRVWYVDHRARVRSPLFSADLSYPSYLASLTFSGSVK